uniref:peptidylprolyl isomerase n=1 Tax=Compsopogon caeruleus TaxID=31354 RepID=A0A6T6BV34_9RHOD
MVAKRVADRDLHASQFFILTSSEHREYLDSQGHTIFGCIVEGLDVLSKINTVFVENHGRLFRPLKPIFILHTIVLHDPTDDPVGFLQMVPPESPRVPSEVISDEEEDGDEQSEAAQEKIKAREARSRAEVLEMIGDIADADLQPPENVLFICKLNPLTREDDLEMIFSRFGECSVQIIREPETGNSLCYGFIEFDVREACEKAYFKMDNVLIDDRRVRVDFSQSVSKLWNRVRRGQRSKICDEDCPPQIRDNLAYGGTRNRREFVFDSPSLYRKAARSETNARTAVQSSTSKRPRF